MNERREILKIIFAFSFAAVIGTREATSVSAFFILLLVGTGSCLFFNFSEEFITFYFTEFHRPDLVYIASDRMTACGHEHLASVGTLIKILHESAAVKTVSNLNHRAYFHSDVETSRYFKDGENVHIVIPECAVKQPFEFYFSLDVFRRENVRLTSLAQESKLSFIDAAPKFLVMPLKQATYFVTRKTRTNVLSFSYYSRTWPDYALVSVDLNEPGDAMAKLRMLEKAIKSFVTGERITVSCSIEDQKREEVQILKSIISSLNVSNVLSYDSTYGRDIVLMLIFANEDIYLHYLSEPYFRNVVLQPIPLFVVRHQKLFHAHPAWAHHFWVQLQAFDIYAWILILVSLGLVTCLLIPWTSAWDHANNLVGMFGVMLGKYIVPFWNRSLPLYVIWILACIVLGTVYQSRLISIMGRPSWKSVEAEGAWRRVLLKKLPVCFSRYSRITGKSAFDVDAYVLLSDSVLSSPEECMHMVWNGTRAFIGSEEDVSGIRLPEWARHLSLKVGTSGAFFFAVRPKLVHKERIIRTFKASFETGISNARRQGFAREGEARQSYYAKLPVEPTPIGLDTLSGVFCVYLIGAALSIFCFFLEIHL